MEQVANNGMGWPELAQRLKERDPEVWASIGAAEREAFRTYASSHWLNRLEMPISILLGAVFGMGVAVQIMPTWSGYASEGWWFMMAANGLAWILMSAVVGVVGMLMYWLPIRRGIEAAFFSGVMPGDARDMLTAIRSNEGQCERMAKLCETEAADAYRRKVVSGGSELLQIDVLVAQRLAKEEAEAGNAKRAADLAARLNSNERLKKMSSDCPESVN